MNKQMKKLNWMIAMMAMTAVLTACGSDDTTTTTPDTTADVAADTTVDTTPDTTVEDIAADVTATDVAADTTVTAAAGCTSSTDQAFMGGLLSDETKNNAFRLVVKDCTLTKGCLAKPTANDKVLCISQCIADANTAMSLDCASCFGMNAACGAGPCLAKCAVDAGSQDCKDCMATNCDAPKNLCAAGKCDPYDGSCTATK
jgi:hypothetical protein